MKQLRIGTKIKLINKDYEDYEQLKGKELTISHIARNANEHPGYDEGCGRILVDCQEINFSLYEWEFRLA